MPSCRHHSTFQSYKQLEWMRLVRVEHIFFLIDRMIISNLKILIFNPGQSHDKNEILGKITLRHAYEIADYHAKDDWYIAR